MLLIYQYVFTLNIIKSTIPVAGYKLPFQRLWGSMDN